MNKIILMSAALLFVMVSCSQEEMPLRQDDDIFSQEVTTHIPKSKARTVGDKFYHAYVIKR